MSAVVILSFFSPAGYELPKRHFHSVVHTLNAQGIPLAVAQAVLPGQEPQPIPSSIPSKTVATKSLLFHKESLWNIAARELTKADKLIFIDADIVFHSSDWFSKCSEALDEHDVIQPYSEARWLDREGRVDMIRPPATDAIRAGMKPALKYYHPGFGWGITRSVFERLGGLYDLSAAGNSDALFALALRENILHDAVLAWFAGRQDKTVLSDSYKSYRRKASSMRLSVGTPSGVGISHLWHGDRSDRRYISRGDLFPRNENFEYAFHRAPSGLLEWNDTLKSNEVAGQYFVGKKDDG